MLLLTNSARGMYYPSTRLTLNGNRICCRTRGPVGILGRPMCEHVRDFKVSSAIEIASLSLFSESIDPLRIIPPAWPLREIIDDFFNDQTGDRA
jgi:hypothetical protein